MKSLNEQAADLLENAGAVLWLPEWWTTEISASDKGGRHTGIFDLEACRFCASGALTAARVETRVSSRVSSMASVAMDDQVGMYYVDFNDRAKNSKQVAIAMFLAADKLRRGAL